MFNGIAELEGRNCDFITKLLIFVYCFFLFLSYLTT